MTLTFRNFEYPLLSNYILFLFFTERFPNDFCLTSLIVSVPCLKLSKYPALLKEIPSHSVVMVIMFFLLCVYVCVCSYFHGWKNNLYCFKYNKINVTNHLAVAFKFCWVFSSEKDNCVLNHECVGDRILLLPVEQYSLAKSLQGVHLCCELINNKKITQS